MQKIRVKVINFDDLSKSLIVSFGDENATDESLNSKNHLAYQPIMWPDIYDPNEILKRIAQSGISVVELEKIKEQFASDENRINSFKNLVGQTVEFNVDDLLNPTANTDG